MAKPISNNAQEQNPAEPRDVSNLKFELSKELLTKLQNNTFSRRCEEDVIGHIGKVLEILELAKIADAQEAKDIYEVINREYSPIPIPTRHDIDNPDDLCRTEEFTVHVLHLPRNPQMKKITDGEGPFELGWLFLKRTCVELIQAC
ncbi:hypothetical protein Tco_1506730 [Tanacetum coccineum]